MFGCIVQPVSILNCVELRPDACCRFAERQADLAAQQQESGGPAPNEMPPKSAASKGGKKGGKVTAKEPEPEYDVTEFN